MKLLRDKKEIEGLQELIDNWTSKNKPIPQQCTTHKVDKSKKRTNREIRLTAQIGEYKMDQVILDLGSNESFLSKKNWERMRRTML